MAIRAILLAFGGFFGVLCGIGLVSLAGVGASISHPGGCIIEVHGFEWQLGYLDESICFGIGWVAAFTPVVAFGVVGVISGNAVYETLRRR